MSLTITLHGFFHREQHCMGVRYPRDTQLNNIVRQPGARWSRTHGCWHMPLCKESYTSLVKALGPDVLVNRENLDTYMRSMGETRVQTEGPASNPKPQIQRSYYATQSKTQVAAQPQPEKTIHSTNSQVLTAMEQTLDLKGYSASTIRTYLNEMRQFLSTLASTPANSFPVQRIKDYLQYCHTTLNLSENTIHSRMNALKFYYEQVLHREKFFYDIPRPKKQIRTPRFFSQDEVVAILKSAENIKHKTMLMLCYSTGMRVSEVVNLKTTNIMSDRRCIHIEQAKGKKDRLVPLSPVLLVMLREYYRMYKPSKTGYLFEGQAEKTPYSTRSLQLVLEAAKKKAGILRPGSIHALRHSFATHLLDKGTDISMIQKLLGHNDIKTTLRYLHTTNKDLLNIISPLDDLEL
jgi:site-specific recombinase XerD